MVYTWMKKASIFKWEPGPSNPVELFYTRSCLMFHEMCYIYAPWKSVTLKING